MGSVWGRREVGGPAESAGSARRRCEIDAGSAATLAEIEAKMDADLARAAVRANQVA